MYLQDVDTMYDLKYNAHVSFGELYKRAEWEWLDGELRRGRTPPLTSPPSTRMKLKRNACSSATIDPLKKLVLPSYDFIVKAAHAFNVLDARGAISVTERQRYILRVRTLARSVAEAYLAQREALGFPLLAQASKAAE